MVQGEQNALANQCVTGKGLLKTAPLAGADNRREALGAPLDGPDVVSWGALV